MAKPYCEWLLNDWLTDLETRNTQEIQLGLDRIHAVAKVMQLLKPKCKVITVAGTNGKGSTVTALEQIYHTAGYNVGTYTSPHLIQFNERIRVNIRPIIDSDLCAIFCLIEEARGQTVLTYFEMVTLAALWYFKTHSLDIIILEVGLGGRLDATNIIDADLSIITTIDFDHQDFLGDTLEQIAYEKAGILRKEKPFIYADMNPPASIISEAKRLNASAYFLSKDFSIDEQEFFWNLEVGARNISGLPRPKIQLKSAAAAITACLILESSLPVTEEQLHQALSQIFIPGRLQFQDGEVRVLYDVSHNVQSVHLLAETLRQLPAQTKIHAVFSALKDKDIIGLISPLRDCIDCWYPAQLDGKRAASANFLLSCFQDAEIYIDICYDSPLIAFETALDQARPGELIVVYGSFFTVSHVMAFKPK